MTLPSIEELHAFLKRHYRHERFEGRDTPEWGNGYSMAVTQGHLDDLENTGSGYVSRHESVTGRAVIFSRSLQVLEGSEAREAIRGGTAG